MSPQAMTPEAFEGALVAIVPTKVLPKIRAVYFDAVTQLHEAVVVNTPVDTGYLRAGFTATEGAEAPIGLAPRVPRTKYLPRDGAAFATIARAAATLKAITLGFTAEYAPYVEDWAHMVKSARGQWAAIVGRAVANQQEGP